MSNTRMYPWGDDDPNCSRLNYSDEHTGECRGDTSRVGSYPAGASPYGAMDMSGNVVEWVNDWYDPDYYSVSPYRNPQGPATPGDPYLVGRGGSWGTWWYGVRAAVRWQIAPFNRLHILGFRCAVSAGP